LRKGELIVGHAASCVDIMRPNLPDELAQKADSAGLLSAEAMEAMLREQLRRRVGHALQSMWLRGPQEERERLVIPS
jgi:hypothetical protein